MIEHADVITRELISTRTSFVNIDVAFGLRLQLPTKFIDLALARADGAEIDDVSTIVFGGIGNRDEFFMDI